MGDLNKIAFNPTEVGKIATPLWSGLHCCDFSYRVIYTVDSQRARHRRLDSA